MSTLRVILAAGAVLLFLAASAFFSFFPSYMEGRMNVVRSPPPYPVSDAARALHQSIPVADLHADSLLWNRDLLRRSTRGHVDLPRLEEANVALQVFSCVTKVPPNISFDRNDDQHDIITLLTAAQLRPIATWNNLLNRATDRAERLHIAAARSEGRLTIIRTAGELKAFNLRRQQSNRITAGLLAMEGLHALHSASDLDKLFDSGYRMMGLAHFFDNQVAGSSAGVEKGGLTTFGRETILRMQERRILIDLAHASPRTIDDVLRLATRPVVVSHTGVKGVCDNSRNLSDDAIRGVARTGGVIGIAFFEPAICGTDVAAIVRSIQYVARLTGADHVALGSDFDGAIPVPFDVTGLPQITEELLKAGVGAEDIAKIMGGNVLRLLEQALP